MKTQERHFAETLQRSFTVSLHNSAFDNILAKCRKVVGHFKHSPASAAELEQKQIELGQKKESLIQNIPTRWNSTLDMIKSVRRNEQPLRDVLTTHNTKISMPTTAEMDKLQKLEMLLEPCRYVTELLGGEKYVSCSVVLPAFCHLSRVMESSDDDPAYVVKFKSTFRTDLETRKENANIAYLKIATALDLRFKDLKCIPRAERGEVWASVTNLLKEQRVVAEEAVEATTSKPSKRKFSLLAASSESDSEHKEDSIENGVRRYRAEPTISTEACPLQWWSKHAGSHSRLASIEQKYLATPATSVHLYNFVHSTCITESFFFWTEIQL
ncbi:E3 SUMO-protein ligase ZBED1-like [Tachysurus ichikawai]